MLLLALFACGRCDPTPRVRDGTGSWTEEEVASLQATLDDWLAAVGPERVCVAGVDVGAADAGATAPGRRLTVSVDAAEPATDLRTALCTLLDESEALSAHAEEIAPGEGGAELISWCSAGPPDFGWVDEVDAACGGDRLDGMQRFLLDTVYPHAPAHRDDGAIRLVASGATVVAGLGADDVDIYDMAEDGEEFAALFRRGSEWSVVRVNLDAGAVTTLLTGAFDSTTSERLYGGADGVTLSSRHGSDPTVLTDLSSGATLSLTPGPLADAVAWGWGARSEGVVQAVVQGDRGLGQLASVNLASGAGAFVDVPSQGFGPVTQVQSLAPGPDGLALQVLEITAVQEGNATTNTVNRALVYRYDRVTEAFTPLWDDAAGFTVTGVLPNGLYVGVLWGRAGSVMGALDPATDRLLVSTDLCLETDPFPFLTIDGRSWSRETSGDDLVFTSFTWSL